MEEKKSRVFRVYGREVEVDLKDLEDMYYRGLRPRWLSYNDFKEIITQLNEETFDEKGE